MILHKVQERCVIATYLIFSAYEDNNYKIQSYFLLIYTVQRTKKVEKPKPVSGPQTRSASGIAKEKEKLRSTSPSLVVSSTEKGVEGKGTMADYLALRERQKKNAAKASASGMANKYVAENVLPDIENEEVEAGTELM